MHLVEIVISLGRLLVRLVTVLRLLLNHRSFNGATTGASTTATTGASTTATTPTAAAEIAPAANGNSKSQPEQKAEKTGGDNDGEKAGSEGGSPEGGGASKSSPAASGSGTPGGDKVITGAAPTAAPSVATTRSSNIGGGGDPCSTNGESVSSPSQTAADPNGKSGENTAENSGGASSGAQPQVSSDTATKESGEHSAVNGNGEGEKESGERDCFLHWNCSWLKKISGWLQKMKKLVAESLTGLTDMWRTMKEWLPFGRDTSTGASNPSTETSGATSESVEAAAQPQAVTGIATEQGLSNGKGKRRRVRANETVVEAKEKVTEMCRRAGWSESLCQQWWESINKLWTTRVPSRKRQRRTTDGNIGSAGVAGQGTKTESTSNSEKSVAASSGSEVTAPQRQSYTFTTTTITSSITVGSGSKGLDKQQNVEVREETKPAPSSPEKGTPSAGTRGYIQGSTISCTSIPASIDGPTPSCRSVSTYRSISEHEQGDNESATVSKLTPIPFYQKTTFWLMGLIMYTSEVLTVTGILV